MKNKIINTVIILFINIFGLFLFFQYEDFKTYYDVKNRLEKKYSHFDDFYTAKHLYYLSKGEKRALIEGIENNNLKALEIITFYYMHDYLIQNEENPNVKREKNIEELNLLLDKNQEIYDRDFYYIYKKIINNKLDANLHYFENKLELKAKVCETYPLSLHKGILLEICKKDTL
jgi:hypothetical protein